MKILTLYRKLGKSNVDVFLDDSDYDIVRRYKWYLNNNIGYVSGFIDGKKVYLHRFIMGYPANKCVDHINRNKLDNRKSNLRICSTRENVINSKLSKNNTSGISGISFRDDRNKFRAYIMVNRKQIFLGYYSDIEDAIFARRQAEIKYFGEFAPQYK